MTDEVIRGRIRVDARRAVEKLRAHQLVDLHHYTHEIARAAVASGAARIVVEYDADDVIVRWHGEALVVGTLGRLLDHVLTEVDDAAGRRLRLLAMGVNAALGLSPVFVDVYAVDEGGRCRRARWTAALLSREVDVEPEEVAAPTGLVAGGVQVHVRRRLGWDVVRRATLGGVPREVSSLLGGARHLESELVVAGELVSRETARVVASVPLRLDPRLGAGLSARLEIVSTADRSPLLVFVEQGIELVRYALDPTPVFPEEPLGDLHLPVRVVVAAEQLPTNASRSAIREDSPLADAVVEAARLALADAVDGVVARWRGQDEVPVGVTVAVTRRDLEDALGAFVSVVAAAASRGQALHASSSKLLRLPVLHDGLGRPISYADLGAGEAVGRTRPLYLHRGEPLPEALSPWVRDVIMVRGGRRAEAALTTFEHRDAAPLVEHAMAGLERMESFLSHAPTEVAVPASVDHVLVEGFEVESGPFRGLQGEVALCAMPSGRAKVRVFYEQRELAVQHLSPAVSGLPLDIALAWDERIRVRFGFDGVEDDETLRSAIWYALQIGVEVVRRVIVERGDDPRIADRAARTAAWVRAALRTRCEAWAALGLHEGYRRSIDADDPLRAVPAWATVEGGEVATSALDELVAGRGALCFVEPGGTRGRPQDDRIVVVLDEEQRRAVGGVLGREPIWVPYERGIVEPGVSWATRRGRAVREALDERLRRQREAAGSGSRLALVFERPGVRGLVVPATQTERVVLHAGRVVTTELFARRFGPVIVVADDETVVPSPDWRGVSWSGRTWAPPSVEYELLVTLVAALEGDASALAAFGGDVRPASLGVVGRSYLALSFAALEQELNEEADEAAATALVHLSARAVDLAVFRMVGNDGQARWVSTGDILDAHGSTGPIPTLGAEPGFRSHDWHPLIVEDDTERAALREWFGGRLVAADHLLGARRQRAAEETQRKELLAQPPIDPFDMGELVSGEELLGRFEDEEGTACVALRPDGLDATVVDVAYQRRPVLRDTWMTYPLPVVARVSLENADAFESSFRAITDAGRGAARRLVGLAAADLVRTHLAEDEDGRALRSMRFSTLVAELFGPAGPANETLLFGDFLERTARWPTVQGGTCRLPEARRGRGEIYVGRARYEPWRKGARPGAFDRAIVHVDGGPLGALHGRILRDLKVHTRDVSDAVDALQRRRGAGAEASAPRLSGEPAHPLLRSTIGELAKAHGLTGELELTDGSPRLVIGDLSGPARDAATHPTAPVRAVVWSETVASEERDARIAKRIDRLAARLLVRVAQGMVDTDALPPFAVRLVRAEIGRLLVAESAIDPALRQAPVFVDTEGRRQSLDELDALQGRQKPIWTTSAAPPYPDREDRRVIVRLDEDERVWLRRALPLRNMTSVLERTLEGQRRRASEPVGELRLSDELRRASLFSGYVSTGDGLEGEVGILAPEHERLRGIAAHVGGRPLCSLDDRPGWPICGAVDDDQLRPNPFFDGPRQIEDGDRTVARVRAEADDLLERVLVAPEAAVSSRFIDVTDESRGLRVRGRLWLELDSAVRPSVTMLSAGERLGRSQAPLARLTGPEGLDRTVPVSGALFVEHLPRDEDAAAELSRMAAEMTGGDASHHFATELALEAAVAMADELAGALPQDQVDRLVWTLALLEAPFEEPPVARGTEGEVAAAAVLSEIRERQAIWTTDRRGDADGQFPGTPPRFVLVAEDNRGLLAALEARSSRTIVRDLGGAVRAAAEKVRERRPPLPEPLARYLSKRREGSPVVEPEATPEEPLVDPVFSGLVSTVRSWFGGGAPAPVPTTLRQILEAAIARLGLPGEPVLEVGFSRRGRAVRYDESNKRIVINRDHPAILALIPPDDEPAGASLRLVLAAIVGELNRSHEAVTATAELEALRYLLESKRV